MFFPKLRRKAKWVFAFLALAFALAFVVAGVGTGVGSGFGDYLAELFNRQPGTDQVSVDDARERVRENPRDADAQRDLANALQSEQQTDEAIVAWQAYVKLRPDDPDALQSLASLYAAKATEAEQRAAALQAEAERAYFGDEIRDPSSKFAEQLGSDPITDLVRQDVSQAFSEATSTAQGLRRQEADTWEMLTKLEPEEAAFFADLGRAATSAQDWPRAIRAYRRYLQLAPDAADAPQVRQLIQQLRLQQQIGPVTAP
jgi:tetratricopeptide (TPR) repeat protein